MKTTNTHVYFYGGPLSNWYPSEFNDRKGIHFPTAEHAFMYYKALLFKDTITANKILSAPTPIQAKALGRQFSNYNDIVWGFNRMECMKAVLYLKFANVTLKAFLLDTGSKQIVEASPYDMIWGVGLGENDPAILNAANWKGQNLLGKLLMIVRDTYRCMPRG